MPPAKNQTFVADDDGTGADSQANIVQSIVPGLLRIASARDTGTGVILTPSGLGLASAQVAGGRGTVTVRLLPSGRTFTARVVGSDPAHGLTLLQLDGGTFTPVAIGNARGLTAGAAAVSVNTAASGRAFTPDIGAVSGTGRATVTGGHRVTGLIRATTRFLPGQGAGGRLASLSGQGIGIDLAGTPDGTSYAVPINQALAIARWLAR